MKILICDDDLNFAGNLEHFLSKKLPEGIQLYTCRDRNQLMDLLSEEAAFDLLLMDICLEQDNGIQLSKTILEQFPSTSVIFITGYPDLFYESVYLTVRPCGFIKKPVNQDLLLSLIRQIIQEKKENARDWILLKAKNGMKKISASKIRYVESQKHVLFIHSGAEILESYGRLSDIAAVLPDYFLHCHKSFLVNADYIHSYEGDHFLLDDGTHIGISQARRKEIRQKFFHYLDQQPFPKL